MEAFAETSPVVRFYDMGHVADPHTGVRNVFFHPPLSAEARVAVTNEVSGVEHSHAEFAGAPVDSFRAADASTAFSLIASAQRALQREGRSLQPSLVNVKA